MAEQRHGHPFGHRREQRHRDGAAFAGLLARDQRLEHGGVGVHAGADVGRRDADPARRMLGAGDRGQPALGLHQQIVGAAVLVGAVIAVARDVDRDQPLVLGAHRGRAEARALGRAGRQVLDQHVGLADQAMQQREVVGLLEVEHDRLLAAVQPDEIAREPVDVAVVAAREIAFRPLDLDDARAGVGQPRRAVGGGHRLLDAHHQQAVQRSRHPCSFLRVGRQHAIVRPWCN